MMINFDKELFAEKLREYRGNNSQGDIADKLGIHRTTISLLENSKQIPTLEILQRFCEATDASIDSFFKKETQDPVLLMMGQLKESDKPKILNVLERIKIREKYIAISRRCDN